MNDKNVWVARRATAAGTFSQPEPVNELNSAVTDVPNWVSPDGCTIYISSDRNAPAGTRHIWVAVKPRSQGEGHAGEPPGGLSAFRPCPVECRP